MRRDKPHSPILNRGHKFARGLQFACPFAWGGIGTQTQTERDIAGGLLGDLDSTMTATDRIVGLGGRGLDLDGSNDWIDFGDNLDLGTSDFTAAVLCIGKSDLTGSTAAARLIQKRGTGTAGTVPGFNLAIRRSGSNVRFDACLIDDGTAEVLVAANIDTGIDIGELGLFSIERVRTTNGALRANGRTIFTETHASLTGSVDNARKLTIGASDVSLTQFASIEIYGAWVWDYALGDALVEFAADPYDMFRPRRRVFNVPVAGAFVPYPSPRGTKAGMNQIVGGVQ